MVSYEECRKRAEILCRAPCGDNRECLEKCIKRYISTCMDRLWF